ncbi:MAG: hypothetical protein KDI88_09695 [Gammaproteobacteria bacterium]|nr:hypothetical protein [Gammaproteobacteria bacterium]
MFRNFVIAWLLLGGLAAPAAAVSYGDEGLSGRVHLMDRQWYFVADRKYVIADYTRIETYDEQPLSRKDLVDGRLSHMLSSTSTDVGGTPIVTHMRMGPPI